MHRRNRSSVQAFVIPGQFSNDDLKFYLPKTIAASSKGGEQPYTAHLEPHLSFRATAEPWHQRNDPSGSTNLGQASTADLRAINLAFPNLQNPTTILAMAAWFTTLCTIDDLIESLSPASGRQALLESIIILRQGYVPHSVSTSGHRSSFIGTPEARIHHISYAFRAHATALLSESAYCRFCEGVCNTWNGIMAEAAYRTKGARPPSLEAYMGIRTRTIGLQPFVVLLETEMLEEKHVKSEALTALIREINVVVGLQNDVLGLEKDIGVGEVMNFVVVASRVEGRGAWTEERLRSVEEAVVRAVDAHNKTLESVKGLRRAILDAGKGDGEELVAEALYRFATTHYFWASAARRYQAN